MENKKRHKDASFTQADQIFRYTFSNLGAMNRIPDPKIGTFFVQHDIGDERFALQNTRARVENGSPRREDSIWGLGSVLVNGLSNVTVCYSPDGEVSTGLSCKDGSKAIVSTSSCPCRPSNARALNRGGRHRDVCVPTRIAHLRRKRRHTYVENVERRIRFRYET
ncbi:hypothetical protein EVAR_46995_1 [Eumeta japonica]|uniref:Uncharacterized protein n=1 Tax=Eumeta variegata TaxID=151549 RepID=A0A4C1X7S4_EUMVA|nr:hypothetical protein EVAR_46995_1 [Eumeta japonica]